MVPRRNQGPLVAADTWLAAWHALVSWFLVMIHYQTTDEVLFSRVPSWLSLHIVSYDPYLRPKVVELPPEVAKRITIKE
jgi:hypothetical protein